MLLVSTGQQTARCMEAAALLAADGIEAGVIHVPSIKPLDGAALADAAHGVPLVVTAEEHSVLGGLGGSWRRSSGPGTGRMERIGIEDDLGRAAPTPGRSVIGLTPDRIADRVSRTLAASASA